MKKLLVFICMVVILAITGFATREAKAEELPPMSPQWHGNTSGRSDCNGWWQDTSGTYSPQTAIWSRESGDELSGSWTDSKKASNGVARVRWSDSWETYTYSWMAEKPTKGCGEEIVYNLVATPKSDCNGYSTLVGFSPEGAVISSALPLSGGRVEISFPNTITATWVATGHQEVRIVTYNAVSEEECAPPEEKDFSIQVVSTCTGYSAIAIGIHPDGYQEPSGELNSSRPTFVDIPGTISVTWNDGTVKSKEFTVNAVKQSDCNKKVDCPEPECVVMIENVVCITYLAAPILEIRTTGNLVAGWSQVVNGAQVTIRFTDGHMDNALLDLVLTDGESLQLQMKDNSYIEYRDTETNELLWFQNNCERHGSNEGQPSSSVDVRFHQGQGNEAICVPVADLPKS